MTILCAWCCQEGQPGYLGEREPLDNPEPTHGVCPYHTAQVLEALHRGDDRDRYAGTRSGTVEGL